MDILWLGQPECHDQSIVGGKIANLSLLAADHAVPPGFALPAAAAEGFAELGSGRSLPDTLQDQLTEAYARLNELCGTIDVSVAVRSSAIDEDGVAASFAGQHDTYLNVTGREAVADAIVRCWASVRNPSALEYRKQQGLRLDSAGIAVLVQQLVPSDVSAIVFGADPVSGRRDVVTINSSWGLGESVVGGTVTPDTHVVRKEDLALVSGKMAVKTRMTVPMTNGTKEVDVPRILQSQPSISTEQAVEMARLAIELESRMGWPPDIECAYHADKLHLLQCRPITTL